MLEETGNKHPITISPSLSYWVCSHSPSTNNQISPPWGFIRTFLSSGFCSQFLLHPPPPSLLLWAPGKHTYSAKGSSCKSSNSSPSACVESVSRCPVSSRYTLPPGDIWVSIIGGCPHGGGGGRDTCWELSVVPVLCRHSSKEVWGSSRASALSWGAKRSFLHKEAVVSLELLMGDVWRSKEE